MQTAARHLPVRRPDVYKRQIQTFEHMELVVDFARLLDTVAHAVKYTANAFNLGT